MTHLGLRLALVGGRTSLAGLALTTLAVATGTAVLLFALSAMPAFEDRAARAAWRSGGPDMVHGTPKDLYLYTYEDRFRDRPVVTVLVSPGSTAAPIPPGIPRVPADGEAWVSPALAELIAATPHDELGTRFGNVVGTIGTESVSSPDELVAIVGGSREELEALGPMVVAQFATAPTALEIPLVGRLIIVLAVVGALVPVAVFVATATRLSAARREQRLAALRLVGATPGQVVRLAAAEALLPTVPGALLGVLLFLAARPLVARIPLDERLWYVDAIAPPVLPALALLAAVPVVGVLAAVATLRRLVVSPLGVHRRSAPRSPSRWGPLVLVVAIALLVVSLTVLRTGVGDERLIVPAVAFGGILLGIALSGPWLTSAVGHGLRRLPGATSLLAGRRLVDDPRSSFSAIAGVIMAVYVASAFFGFIAYAEGRAAVDAVVTRPGQVTSDLSFATGDVDELVARLAATPGVTGVAPLRAVELQLRDAGPSGGDDGARFYSAWVARCSDVVAVLDLGTAACSNAPVHLLRETDVMPGMYGVMTFTASPAGDAPPSAQIELAADGVAALAPLASGPSPLPELVVDPALVGAVASRFPVTRLYVSTDGTQAAQERARTLIVSAAPGSWVRTSGERTYDSTLFAELGRIVGLGLVGSLALAGCSLAVATTTAMLERRRQFALLRSAGMDVRSLRAIVLIQAAVPLVAVAAFSAVLGIVTAQLILRVAAAEGTVALPDPTLYATLAASLAAAMLVVAVTLPPLERLTRPETVRLE